MLIKTSASNEDS